MNRPGIQPALGVAECRVPYRLRAGVARRMPRRSVRVGVLVGVILALSLADLALTLVYVTEIGLIEDNPLAREVLRAGGPGLLVVAKLGSVGFTTGVLFWARRRGIAELAALFGALVMGWVTARWIGYIETSAQLTATMEEWEHHSQGAWMTTAEVETD
jgi:hypothetical protein